MYEYNKQKLLQNGLETDGKWTWNFQVQIETCYWWEPTNTRAKNLWSLYFNITLFAFPRLIVFRGVKNLNAILSKNSLMVF